MSVVSLESIVTGLGIGSHRWPDFEKDLLSPGVWTGPLKLVFVVWDPELDELYVECKWTDDGLVNQPVLDDVLAHLESLGWLIDDDLEPEENEDCSGVRIYFYRTES